MSGTAGLQVQLTSNTSGTLLSAIGSISKNTSTNFIVKNGTNYQRAYCVFNFPTSITNDFYVRFYSNGTSGFSVKKPKLEIGNIPSEWSASLYDVSYEQGLVGNNLLQNSLIFDVSKNYKHLSQVEEGHTYTISFAAASNSTTFYLGFSGSEEVVPSTNTFSFSTSPYTFTATDTHVFIKAVSTTSLNKLKLEIGSSASSFILTETEIQQINSSLQQTVDGIYTSMYDSDGNLILINSQELQDKLKDSLSGVNSKIVANETTIAAVQTQYSTVDNRIQEIIGKVNINDSYDLDGDGTNEQCITISTKAGVLGSTRVVITSERLGFVRNDEVIAYISGQKLFITSAEITTSLKIGTKSTSNKSGSGIKFIPSENGVAVIWE